MACNTVTVVQRGSSIVKIGGVTPKQITLQRNTIAEINANRPRVVPVSRQTIVDVPQRPTDVTVNGGMGVQGRRGEPGGSIAPINFAWGDAARVVYTAPISGLLSLCRVDITTPFNGAGAAIRVGTTGSPEAAMPAGYNDPSAIAKYQNTPDFRMAAGDELNLVIDPGFTPTAGAGTLILEFLPD